MRATRLARTKQRILKAPGTFIVILVMIVGCSGNSPRGSSEWISANQAKAEYVDESRRLILAPGWRWPEAPQYESKASDGRKINYGVNAGRVDASWYWHCSWARTYFAAESSRDRETALKEVLRLKESSFYRYGLTLEDQSARDNLLALAESGDPEQLKAIIDWNCPLRSE